LPTIPSALSTNHSAIAHPFSKSSIPPRVSMAHRLALKRLPLRSLRAIYRNGAFIPILLASYPKAQKLSY
jgi:hypothetical protein